MSFKHSPHEGGETRVAKAIATFPRLFKGAEPSIGASWPKGWDTLLRHLCADINAMLDDDEAAAFEVQQIKEKFGALRFYWTAYRADQHPAPLKPSHAGLKAGKGPAILARVLAAQELSSSTCMLCGGPGRTRQNGWVHVSCDKCQA
jgi:hypothetical protein